MQKVKVFAVFAALLLSGCDWFGASFTYKDETPQQTRLSFQTPSGTVYSIAIDPNMSLSEAIAANTQMGNILMLDADFQQAQQRTDARRDWLGLVHTAIICCACVLFGLGAVKLILAELRGGKTS